MGNKSILFVVSKSTGYKTLKSFLEVYTKKNIKVLTLDDTIDSRSYFEKIKQICLDHQIECKTATRGQCLTDSIFDYNPDYVFVCGWYWIISDEVLTKVPNGIYGIHNSLLPKYRGHAPLIWSLLNGDEEVGASLFELTSGMDTGRVFHQWAVNVSGRYIKDVLLELECSIENEFANKFIDILDGRLKGVEQDHSKASYGAKRVPEDGIIDWNLNAVEIERQIRTLNDPYPLSFGYFNDKKIYIKKAAIFQFETLSAPGQVVFKDKEFVVIGCGGNTALMVYEAFEEQGNFELSSLFSKITSPSRHYFNNNLYTSK